MSMWSKFTAWLSGWPESKEIYHFEEEEKTIKENNKNIGKNSEKKKIRKQGNIQ